MSDIYNKKNHMKKTIKLTEGELRRIIKKILLSEDDASDSEQSTSYSELSSSSTTPTPSDSNDESQFHRYRKGGNPGFETFFKNPLDTKLAKEFEDQLVNDIYAKGIGGGDFLRGTNLGKGTGKIFIVFNDMKLTVQKFIAQVQEDAKANICHSIVTFDYNNRFLAATKITITTKEKSCKTEKPKPTKKCKYDIRDTTKMTKEEIKRLQQRCIKRGFYNAEFTDGTTQKCSKVDGIWGCCTESCVQRMSGRVS